MHEHDPRQLHVQTDATLVRRRKAEAGADDAGAAAADGAGTDWSDKPLYRNRFVYDSPRLAVPAKTAADVEALSARADRAYAAARLDPKQQRVAKTTHDAALEAARDPAWSGEQLARIMLTHWLAGDAQLLKGELEHGALVICSELASDLDTASSVTEEWSEAPP